MATDFQFRLRHFDLPDNPEALDRRTEPSIGAAARRRRCLQKFAARQCAGRAISYWQRRPTSLRRSRPMPYLVNADLPPSVRRHLPEGAQDIYRAAFNHAYAAHAGDPRQEEAAHRIAWAAVKRRYEKVGDYWEERR